MTKILSCKERKDKRISVGVFLAITALMLMLQPLPAFGRGRGLHSGGQGRTK
jgi:hypothetical protein